ncbi:hypothetical protein BGZ79_000202 [Entomortierella chlamydospora]|nr:hypothetical protein BGZ79_000202 [Entomortierella chlamydospora]
MLAVVVIAIDVITAVVVDINKLLELVSELDPVRNNPGFDSRPCSVVPAPAPAPVKFGNDSDDMDDRKDTDDREGDEEEGEDNVVVADGDDDDREEDIVMSSPGTTVGTATSGSRKFAFIGLFGSDDPETDDEGEKDRCTDRVSRLIPSSASPVPAGIATLHVLADITSSATDATRPGDNWGEIYLAS